MAVIRQPRTPFPRYGARLEIILGQGPFLLGTVILTVFLAVLAPGVPVTIGYLVGCLLILIACLLAILIARDPRGHGLLVLVPLLDVVATILIRGAAFHPFDKTGFVIVFPIIWLAAEFSLGALTWGVIGAAIAAVYPFLLFDEWPQNAAAWAATLAVVLSTAFFAYAIHFVVRALKSQRDRLESLTAQLQASLTAAEDRETIVRGVLDAVEAGIVFYDADGVARMTNATARVFAAQSRGDGADEAHPESLVFYRDRVTPVPPEDRIVAQALSGKLPAGRLYWIGPRENQRAIIASSSRVHLSTGEHDGTVIVSYDVTPLVQAIGVRDDFLATTSHELRTPLTSILGYLELIDAESLGIAPEISVIERNALRLLALISNLLDAGRKSTVHRASTDVAPLVEAVIAAVGPAAKAARVHLFAVAGDPILANVDPRSITQIVDNLLTNAIKFTPAGGFVSVGFGKDAAFLYIRVEDTGVGISAEDQGQMFDRFFRSRSARVNAVPGAGLGLSIVRSLVDAHEGTIDIESTTGDGTTVTVRLPLAGPAAALR